MFGLKNSLEKKSGRMRPRRQSLRTLEFNETSLVFSARIQGRRFYRQNMRVGYSIHNSQVKIIHFNLMSIFVLYLIQFSCRDFKSEHFT